MPLFDYISFSVSPLAKFLFCFLLAASFIIVYFWKPASVETRQTKRRENGMLRNVDVKSNDYATEAKALQPGEQNEHYSNSQQTLIELDQYLKELRQHQINDVDKV